MHINEGVPVLTHESREFAPGPRATGPRPPKGPDLLPDYNDIAALAMHVKISPVMGVNVLHWSVYVLC